MGHSMDKCKTELPTSFKRSIPSDAVRERYQGCLLGGAVGDALGAPVEFMGRPEIFRAFVLQGITDLVPVYGRVGGTDDIQMTLNRVS